MRSIQDISETIDKIEKIAKALDGKVDEYLILADATEEIMTKLANTEATVTQFWSTIKYTIYAANRNGAMIATTIDNPENMNIAERISGLLKSLEPSPLYAPLPEPTGESYRNNDNKILDFLSDPSQLDLKEELELDILENAAGMVRLFHKTRILRHMNGQVLSGEATGFNGYIRVFKGDDASGQWSWTSTNYNGSIARKATTIAREYASECAKLGFKKVSEGPQQVVLSSMVSAGLLYLLADSFNAGSIIFGMSFLQPENIGKSLGSERLTLKEIPLAKELPGYTAFDDEGQKTHDKVIIERGIAKTIIHNTKTASKFSSQTTGNAGIIMPRIFQLEVKSGDMSIGEMIENIDHGVYVTNNWYTRFQNYAEGAFSTVSRDAVFLVERGRPVGCARRIRLSTSLPELALNIEGMSSDRFDIQWWEVPVPVRTPYMLVKNVKVSVAR